MSKCDLITNISQFLECINEDISKWKIFNCEPWFRGENIQNEDLLPKLYKYFKDDKKEKTS